MDGRFDETIARTDALSVETNGSNAQIEALLIEGLDSGDPILLDAQEWARIRADVAARRLNGK